MKLDDGILLRAVMYNNNARIVKVFSKSQGIQSFYVGANKKKELFSYFQPLNLISYTYSKNSKSNLFTFKEINASHTLNEMYSDVKKTSVVFFITEILLGTIREEEQNLDVFEYLVNLINELDRTNNPTIIPVNFLIQWSVLIGIQPLLQSGQYFNIQAGELQNNFDAVCCISEEETAYLIDAYQGKIITSSSNKSRRNLLNTLIKYYSYHLPDFKAPKSLEVIKTVFE